MNKKILLLTIILCIMISSFALGYFAHGETICSDICESTIKWSGTP